MTDKIRQQIERLRKVGQAVYLACEESPADDISGHIREAADTLEQLLAVYEAAIRVVNSNSALAHQDLGEAIAAVEAGQK